MVSACTNSENNGRIISVLQDTTEPDFIAKPESNTMVSVFGLEQDLWQSIAFRYGTITSLMHNKREACVILSENALFGNEIQRKNDVANFTQKARHILETPKDFSKGQYSSIWKPLIEELNVLQKTQSTSTLYLFSDLQENNATWFSVHRYEDLKLLKNNPDKVKELFLKQATQVHRNNPNIKVVVVFQPEDLKQDASFSLLSILYRDVFKELGISISFTSQIQQP
jgi:hypothetical protein